MNPSISTQKAIPPFCIALLIVCFELSPKARAVSPPPDGGDVGFNTAGGRNAPASLTGGSWNVVPSPNTGHPNNSLSGVAAIASNDVWAVGSYNDFVDPKPQVQHWDGQNWTFVSLPQGVSSAELLGVAAVSSTDVWIVGGPLTLHWDGTSLSNVPNPNPGGSNRFFGVAAISSNNVWTVGYKDGDNGLSQTLVAHWDGTSWSVVPSPNVPNQHCSLTAVTAVPGSPNELWAVGRADPSVPFILHWNGTQWSIVPGPPAGSVPLLYGVVAIASNDVWAVGWAGGGGGTIGIILHWDGSTWSVVPSPNPSSTYNYLWGVDAVGPNDVWAVGEFNATGGNQQTLFLRWNGTAWVQVAGDNSGPSGVQFFLRAVSAISGSDIWAVGNNSHTIAEHWDGTRWSVVSTPNLGIGDNVLNGVSGTASNDVWEVGYYSFGTWKQTLIQHWDGTRWRMVRSPNSGKRTNVLNGVVAISPSDAWAVGSADSGVADQTTFTLHWDGTRWRRIPSPSPGTLGLNSLYGVAATSANDVWAVGSYTNSGEFAQTLVVHWDGTSWTVIPSANVPGDNNELFGVVALGPNDVWAVGYHGNAAFGFLTLVEHWDGSTWSVVSSPSPSGDDILYAVSATGANDIWAVGRSRNSFTFVTSALVEHWDGNSWSQALGAGGEYSDLFGVAAVSPGDAWAVGGTALTLIDHWDGNRWRVFPSPSVAGELHAVTAITPCDVWAVGQRHVTTLLDLTLLTLNEHFTCD
jgi:hypothetical protein